MNEDYLLVSRKQITFDLSQKALAQHYPRPKFTINPKFYKKAYSDIRHFMKKNGFEHRQFSVYTSIDKLSTAKVINLIQNMAQDMPWLARCTKEIDVTNISSQHSLLKTLEAATALHVKYTKSDKTPDLASFSQRQNIKERLAAAQATAAQKNALAADQQPEHSKVHSKDVR